MKFFVVVVETKSWVTVPVSSLQHSFFLIEEYIISRPARQREIIICTMCVRACVTQFSLKLLQLHIFGKLLVLMNFYVHQYFLGLVNFGLLLSD